MIVFGGLFPSTIKHYPLEFLCLPFLLWGAFRFGQRGAATTTLVLTAVAIWGTVRGLGPFASYSAGDSLILLQAYVGVAAITTLMLAAVVAERRDAERRLRHLSVSDPLTGIGNYRHLIERLQGEIKRSERTGRPFAVLFLDLNNLKRINDRYGHMVGNRALCRVSEVLQLTSRNIDTPTRFGGDEFALVLPEADEDSARQVGYRISELLAGDSEVPSLTVSQGVAVYPRDAATAESLLGAADHSLYGMKAQSRTESGRAHAELRRAQTVDQLKGDDS
jgi:diguanylate cyclase (GGDEF)-like protein